MLNSRPTAVPQPRPLPLLGNIPQVDADRPVQSMMKLADELGPLYRLQFPTREFYVVSSARLVDELCDERRFRKLVHGPLIHLRPMAGDGLFTAETSSPAWERAHRILMPAFGPQSMRDYFAPMLDIAEQLVTKWERKGPRADHDVSSEMTQLTLDTIALCGFGYRFNSFYQNEMHPFVDAMVRSLAEAGQRSRQLPLQTRLNLLAQRSFDADIAFMNTVVDELIRERKSGATHGERDLLSLMLAGRDPVTGQGLDDENIREQMVTFLIAGHETTSGLLSFALYELLRHPAALARAKAEVDAVLGAEIPRYEHLAKLNWIDQVLRETLRVWPTAPAFAVTPLAPTRIGDRLDVVPGDDLIVLIPSLHRDRSVWGSNPDAFDPERFSPARREAIPANAYKPFGSGVRACIGRPIALQEATLVLAMLLQRFELGADDRYKLSVKETLTLKPEGFTVRARPRDALAPQKSAKGPATPSVGTELAPRSAGHGAPLTVLYGSNTGSSEAFARRIADDGARRGYLVRVEPMDSAVNALPSGGALVVVTASYNGLPPDNAGRFCAWLDELAPGALTGLSYVVFGCGHRDWATTYQAVPSRVDAALERAGATRVAPRGEADARGDFFGDFEGWYPSLWAPLDAASGVKITAANAAPAVSQALYALETLSEGASRSARASGHQPARVVENRELVDLRSPLGRSKRHVALALPDGLSWRCGDYLSVQPENAPDQLARVARRFSLDLDSVVRLSSARPAMASLPVDRPISLRELLGSHVELAQPATRRQLELVIERTKCPPERQRMLALAEDYRARVLEPRLSLLDLLEQCPACELSFAELLEQLPTLKPRLYSIASSPRANGGLCALTVSVLDAPAWSGRGRHRGVGSNYLASRGEGDLVHVAVKRPNTPFRLPERGDTPIVMFAAGTGIAPFRGFLEERACAVEAGEARGEAVLYFGCDHPDVDFLYRDELARWESAGVVSVRPTFCAAPEDGMVYVQHRVEREAERVRALVEQGATLFLCGDGARFAPSVREALSRVLGGDEALRALEREGRFVADVFS